MVSINWNNYPSDGNPERWATKIPSNNIDEFVALLVTRVNNYQYIKDTFGSVTFDRLPDNYIVITTQRGSGGRAQNNAQSGHKYHCTYGHPKGQFRSVIEFAAHVVSLLKRDNLQTCGCILCDPRAWRATKGTVNTVDTRAPTTIIDSTHAPNNDNMEFPFPPSPMDVTDDEFPVNTGVDEDGTPNIFDQLISQAHERQHMNQAITESGSIHWLLEKDVAELPEYLKDVKSTARWTPRLGEIVLVVRNFKPSEKVKFDHDTGVLKIFDRELGPVGLPIWEAAVVTQLNKKTVVGVGLLDQHSGLEGAASDGYRVEPMSEIGSSTKPWSTRYKEIEPVNMRHFSFWRELIRKADLNDPHACHPTVRHALTAMSSLSLVNRYHFTANGQEARIYCKAMYIGAEFIAQGDVVRFSSPQHFNSFGKDVLHIRHIYMSVRLDRTPEPASIHVEGVAYTVDPNHAYGEFQRPVPLENLPFHGMRGYGLWYKMSADNSVVRVPYVRVLTRLVEDKYLKVVAKSSHMKVASGLGSSHLGLPDHFFDITYGLEGVVAAREHSSKFDPRIDRAKGETWYFAEDRVDQLELNLVNGQDVGDKARFGFESAPQPLQEAHLRSMFRARVARQKGPKSDSSYLVAPAQDRPRQSNTKAAGNAYPYMQFFNDEPTRDEYDNGHAERFMDKFEEEFTQRTTDVDFDAFIS